MCPDCKAPLRGKEGIPAEKETGKHIPVDVMEKMRKDYEEPTKAEGFDEVIKV